MSAGALHAVILAGGSGTRFWPLSREKMPKQLLSIFGDQSMLALTLDRACTLVAEESVWIVTTLSQAGEIRRELQTIGRPEVNVLVEPAGRNTAAAIGLAAISIVEKDAQGIMAVFPADHYIEYPQRFVAFIKEGQAVASQEWLVTLGIKPTSPETGYGYIQRGVPLEDYKSDSPNMEAFRVARFTEKPDLEKAKDYIRTGEYFWNSGIFLWKADLFMKEMARYLPEHHQGLGRIGSLALGLAQDSSAVAEIYQGLESISVDYGIMERAERVAVIPSEMGWSDVGSWAALRELLDKDENGNVFQGNVLALDTRNSLIRAEDRIVASLGVEGLVVVDTADALLVCREDLSQEVRKISDRLRDENRSEALIHLQVQKPWGAYRVLDLGDTYQVKWLDVNPGARLSLQSHEHRAEHWTVVSGTATVTLDDQVLEIPCGDHIYIPIRSRHRIENRGQEMVRIIEVQTGDYLGEDDIVRYDDDYGREGTR